MPHFARAAAAANAKWRERERPVAATQGERISRASDVPPAAFPCAGRGLRRPLQGVRAFGNALRTSSHIMSQ